ncbi:MAG: hypothetical protein AAF962_19410 [Actinomycetota bacterium]
MSWPWPFTPSSTLVTPTGATEAVTLDHDGDHLRLTADRALEGLSTGRYRRPSAHVTIDVADLPPGTRLAGFSYTQFALPVAGGADRPFRFDPTPNLNSPPVALPLLLEARDGTVTLLAPLDAWHEQIIAIEQTDEGVQRLHWGWHGDLDRVEAGFTTTLGVFTGDGAADVLGRWGRRIRAAAGTPPRDRYRSPVVSHLSYWTDNGAAYWYRTEPGLDLPTTLERTLAGLDDAGVVIGAVELDSWFYPHETSRPITEVGYLEDVPPTGMLSWTPRPDVLPDGVAALAERLGNRPLILHSRHISPSSPYLTDGEWWGDRVAHPVDPAFFGRWFDDAASWGATTIEQDWMVAVWFGVRELRREPGRARAWQHGLDEAAGATGIDLIWCMATPADFVATVELANVVAVRTSDDYRFTADPADLWWWYLAVNRLADALDLPTFKDCFFTVDDPHPEVEALLSAFSAGAAGIGDRIGRTDTRLLARLARPDGRLIKPDRPLALADRCLFDTRETAEGLCWATTSSGPWRYVVALHTAEGDSAGHADQTITDRFDLDGEYLVYDWRAGTARIADDVGAELSHRDWALWVCCPLDGQAPARRALIGDPEVFVTMGDARVRVDAEDGGAPLGAVLLGADGAVEADVRPLWWHEEAPHLRRG